MSTRGFEWWVGNIRGVAFRRRARGARTLIIVGRVPSAERENPASPQAIRGFYDVVGIGVDSDCLRARFRCVPLSSGDESASVRTSHSDQLRRRAAEKWQDGISLQSTAASNLCEHALPAGRLSSVLVFAAAYRTAHEYLTEWLISTGMVHSNQHFNHP